ncbi:flagellar assembly protein FliH [Billgrantia gudaonensis]|uniref:Flagellar assembly protein FliH n=1 Tax=Billgrantia gudaonensis TaxID=376427 RepID=A0A1G8T3P8_9GAMM|nr:flagellar assembly protein FliH [Halomonas gudaonensis]SDJ35300.1 flagellar assembly protein FliH [Halomonas gudaonensis]
MSDRSSASIERNGAWQRWRMGELAPGVRRQSAEEDSHPSERAQREAASRRAAERQRAELQALHESVRKQAREEGYRAGFEEGRHEGHAQGLEEGRRQAERELDERTRETLAPLTPLAQAFSEALNELDEQIGDDLVALALSTGKQLAGDALKTRPRQILELIRALLHSEPPMTGQQRLWLHPLDHKLVEKHLGEELQAAGWKLQPDDQLTRGGCRVTSASGELDATWESRWQAVKSQVRRRTASADSSE